MSRCDVTDSGSRPIIASSATHSPVSASVISDGPLIVPPGRSWNSLNSMRTRARIGRTSSITKCSIAPGNTSSRNSVISAAVSRVVELAAALARQADAPGPPVPTAACAAASRAIGTRYGEHDT